MHMPDWSSKLDDFLKLGVHDFLIHVGKISAAQAKEKAHLEYDKFRNVIDLRSSQVDKDLEKIIKNLAKPSKPWVQQKKHEQDFTDVKMTRSLLLNMDAWGDEKHALVLEGF